MEQNNNKLQQEQKKRKDRILKSKVSHNICPQEAYCSWRKRYMNRELIIQNNKWKEQNKNFYKTKQQNITASGYRGYWDLRQLQAYNSMKRQKDKTLKDELPKLVGAQYSTGEE